MAQKPPEYDDSDLPDIGTSTTSELRGALGLVAQPDGRTDKAWRKPNTMNARELRALELVTAGATSAQIGAVMNITRRSAMALVDRALGKRALEIDSQTRSQTRALVLDQLDQLWRRWWPLALGDPRAGTPPDKDAADVVLKIHDRVVRIQALDAPIQVEVNADIVVSLEDRANRQAKILADLAEVGP